MNHGTDTAQIKSWSPVLEEKTQVQIGTLKREGNMPINSGRWMSCCSEDCEPCDQVQQADDSRLWFHLARLVNARNIFTSWSNERIHLDITLTKRNILPSGKEQWLKLENEYEDIHHARLRKFWMVLTISAADVEAFYSDLDWYLADAIERFSHVLWYVRRFRFLCTMQNKNVCCC